MKKKITPGKYIRRHYREHITGVKKENFEICVARRRQRIFKILKKIFARNDINIEFVKLANSCVKIGAAYFLKLCQKSTEELRQLKNSRHP